MFTMYFSDYEQIFTIQNLFKPVAMKFVYFPKVFLTGLVSGKHISLVYFFPLTKWFALFFILTLIIMVNIFSNSNKLVDLPCYT